MPIPRLSKIIAAVSLIFSLNVSAVEPAPGWWWDPLQVGTGLNIELQNDTLLVAYFAEEFGVRVAYEAVCTFDGVGCSGGLTEGGDETGINFSFSFPSNAVTGSATIDGFTFPIERFLLGFNSPRPNDMLGVWVATVFEGPLTIGERLVLDTLTTFNDGSPSVEGFRDGTNQEASMGFAAKLYTVVVEDGPNRFVVYELDSDSGINLLTGEQYFIDGAGAQVSDRIEASFARFQQQPFLPSSRKTGRDYSLGERLPEATQRHNGSSSPNPVVAKLLDGLQGE